MVLLVALGKLAEFAAVNGGLITIVSNSFGRMIRVMTRDAAFFKDRFEDLIICHPLIKNGGAAVCEEKSVQR